MKPKLCSSSRVEVGGSLMHFKLFNQQIALLDYAYKAWSHQERLDQSVNSDIHKCELFVRERLWE